MATFIENHSWLAVFTQSGGLVDDYSSVDISDVPVISEDDVAENYGIYREIEWMQGTRVAVAWQTTSPEGELRDFATALPALVHAAVRLMDVPDLAWAPAIVPMFRWNLLPRDLRP